MLRQLNEAEVKQYQELMAELDQLQHARDVAEYAFFQRMYEISRDFPQIVLSVHRSARGFLESRDCKANGVGECVPPTMKPIELPALSKADVSTPRRRRKSQLMVWDYWAIRNGFVLEDRMKDEALWPQECPTAPMAVSQELLTGSKQPIEDVPLLPPMQPLPPTVAQRGASVSPPPPPFERERQRRQTLIWTPGQDQASPFPGPAPVQTRPQISCNPRRRMLGALQRRRT